MKLHIKMCKIVTGRCKNTQQPHMQQGTFDLAAACIYMQQACDCSGAGQEHNQQQHAKNSMSRYD
jgi:hypothetical protein